MPNLEFQIEGAEVLEYAASPTLLFDLNIAEADGEAVRSISLNTQIRIASRERHYSDIEQQGLRDIFGPPEAWSSSMSSLLWTHTVLVVPSFTGSTRVRMPVESTYDFNVAHAKYFHSLEDGEVPLEFLFSGTVFYANGRGLQAVQIPWDREASFRMPVGLWKEMMDHYFPNSAWVRLDRQVFDRLYGYRTRKGFPNWDETLRDLLPQGEENE